MPVCLYCVCVCVCVCVVCLSACSVNSHELSSLIFLYRDSLGSFRFTFDIFLFNGESHACIHRFAIFTWRCGQSFSDSVSL